MLQFNPQLVLKNQFGEQSQNSPRPGSLGYPLLSTLVTLTVAQIIALHATPITIIPAVTGKLIFVEALELSLVHGSAAFTIGTSQTLQCIYTGAVGTIGTVNETGFLDHASSIEADLFPGGVSFVGARGIAVQLTSTDTTIAVGTGSTLLVQALYSLI